MILLWRMVDPLVPGAAGMFLLVAVIYWVALAIIGLTVARNSFWLGLTVPLLGLMPTAFDFLVMIWRDMVLGVVWLLAAALAYSAAERSARARPLISAIALGLVAVGDCCDRTRSSPHRS